MRAGARDERHHHTNLAEPDEHTGTFTDSSNEVKVGTRGPRVCGCF